MTKKLLRAALPYLFIGLLISGAIAAAVFLSCSQKEAQVKSLPHFAAGFLLVLRKFSARSIFLCARTNRPR